MDNDETTAIVMDIISKHREEINRTPSILGLLYDFDLLPEQIQTIRGALSMAAVCEAYRQGLADGQA